MCIVTRYNIRQDHENVDPCGSIYKITRLQFFCDLLELYLISNGRNFPILCSKYLELFSLRIYRVN